MEYELYLITNILGIFIAILIFIFHYFFYEMDE
ncbi:dolichyl-diphosphooligosaccharide--protein glycosyltransferase subunit OST4, putative [Hepatocystis sp. ex Piliocolobus tephrosceles]|nr:dolichyl-diphosphooligosaccharide--protein glycosyltransferase subunit OST4, putative [Hepatocystis sp. ex Piliocolobus tephrosceles]